MGEGPIPGEPRITTGTVLSSETRKGGIAVMLSLHQEPARNKRASTRVRHSLPADIRYKDRHHHEFRFDGAVVDISSTGLGIQLKKIFWGSVGVRSKVTLSLKRKQDTLTWSGYIARLVGADGGVSQLGIEFDKPRLDLTASIRNHVKITISIADDQGATRQMRSSHMAEA